jgi:hypothetical protein
VPITSASLQTIAKRAIRRLLWEAGLDVRLRSGRFSYIDLSERIEPHIAETILRAAPYSMTGHPRLYVACKAAEHVVAAGIRGAIVECGVWRGGTMMAIAETLSRIGATARELWLYDTFEGMTEPTDRDVALGGLAAAPKWHAERAAGRRWIFATLDEVRRNLAQSGYPSERTHYVVGDVASTIPAQMPDQVALLRLDTDWYESTLHELTHLYPRLSPGGILIIDDYGYWEGAREATDEYFARLERRPFLVRVDHSCRVAIKPD